MSYTPDAPSTIVDSRSIQLSPAQINFDTNIGFNLKNRVFTMPISIQVIYNKIINNKK
jgi:hypothetical protein